LVKPIQIRIAVPATISVQSSARSPRCARRLAVGEAVAASAVTGVQATLRP
jgi:hypothetical protein